MCCIIFRFARSPYEVNIGTTNLGIETSILGNEIYTLHFTNQIEMFHNLFGIPAIKRLKSGKKRRENS